MKRTEYMTELRKYLKRLPQEDFEAAIEYFEEYFEEAGEAQEAQAMNDLGTPKQAAEQIIVELAVKNCDEAPQKGIRRNFSALWVGILAVCAAPIALPLAGALAATIAALMVAVLAVVGSVWLTGASAVLAGVSASACSLLRITTSTANAVATTGFGVLLTALGCGVCIAAWRLIQASVRGMTRMFGWLAHRFSKKQEPCGYGSGQEAAQAPKQPREAYAGTEALREKKAVRGESSRKWLAVALACVAGILLLCVGWNFGGRPGVCVDTKGIHMYGEAAGGEDGLFMNFDVEGLVQEILHEAKDAD